MSGINIGVWTEEVLHWQCVSKGPGKDNLAQIASSRFYMPEFPTRVAHSYGQSYAFAKERSSIRLHFSISVPDAFHSGWQSLGVCWSTGER
jgi:hypothetical protein